MEELESLQFENANVRRELRAQMAVCDKLRREKEAALEAYAEAMEEIRCSFIAQHCLHVLHSYAVGS